MVRGNDALPQLLEAAAGDHPPELRLADQKTLERGRVVDLEVRQHPEFFERGLRKILRLVHDQKCAPSLLVRVVEEILQAQKQPALVLRKIFKTKRSRHHTQQIVTG